MKQGNGAQRVKAAGRWWTPEELFLFRQDWNDPFMTRKQTCRKHGVIIGSVHCNRYAQRVLGIAGAESRRKGGGNRGCKLTVPRHAHPFVRQLIAAIIRQGRTCRAVAEEAGLERTSFYQWRRVLPRLDNLEAALNVLGYRLAIVPMADAEEEDRAA